MSTDVDLSQLAIRRDEPSTRGVRSRPHLLTRYVLPLALAMGFVALMAWAARDIFWPAKPVKVVPVLVTDSEAQREGTPLFKAAGWVEPRPTPIRVAALAPGVVKELLVVEDQPVKVNDPIAKLVDDDAQLALDRAKADLKLRLAELAQAEAAFAAARKTLSEDPRPREAPLVDPEAKISKVETELANLPFEIRRAEARLKVATEDLRGKTKASGVVTGIAIDQARSEVEAATALVEGLRQRATSLQKEKAALISRRKALRKQAAASIKAASARVEQAHVAEAEAALRLKRMTILSPINGRVLHLVAVEGTRLVSDMGNTGASDGSTVVTLYRPDRLQVRVDVRYADLLHVHLNQPVRIESPAVESPVEGRVLFKSLADIQKNTLQVKVAIDSPPPVFKPDMLLDVTFLAPKQLKDTSPGKKRQRLYVPDRLVQRGEGGALVWVADQAAGVARRVSVEAGAVGTNRLVEITKGLTMTSRLIVEHEGLADGDRIRVIGESRNFDTSPDDATGKSNTQ